MPVSDFQAYLQQLKALLEQQPQHKRALIRAAVTADLQGLPLTEDRVFDGRRFRIHELEFKPLYLVYFESEVSEALSMRGGQAREQDRASEGLVVHGLARAPEAWLDELLDAMAYAAERRLYEAAEGIHPGAQLAPLVKDWQITSSEITADGEGATILGAIALVFTAVYATMEDDPS